MSKDYYAVLGVEKNADSKQIKKAYREKAKEVHPDVNPKPESEVVFQTLSEAYMVLSDPSKRSVYDAGNELPVFTQNDVAEILRKRDRYSGRVFQSWLNGESRNHYPPTDYKASEKGAMKINWIILVIPIIFLIDISFNRNPQTAAVTNYVEQYKSTGDIEDFGSFIVFGGGIQFVQSVDKTQLAIGDTFEFQRSLIFGQLNTVKTSSDDKFYNVGNRVFPLVVSILVFLIAFLGTTDLLSPESKFNAAIIAGFFALILILTLFFN